MVNIQVSGGKQLLPLTDPLPPEPRGDLPASKAPVGCWDRLCIPCPIPEVLSARLGGVLSKPL